MQTSGSNILKGKVVKVVEGAVNCKVTLEIAPSEEIVGIITKAAATLFGLAEGPIPFAIIKVSAVMFI